MARVSVETGALIRELAGDGGNPLDRGTLVPRDADLARFAILEARPLPLGVDA